MSIKPRFNYLRHTLTLIIRIDVKPLMLIGSEPTQSEVEGLYVLSEVGVASTGGCCTQIRKACSLPSLCWVK
eukprot:14142648-Heterocapsa_arctica.AAC.1